MSNDDVHALLIRLDERMEWMVKEMTDHRKDYKDLLVTVNGHGKWIHVGKLLVPIAVGVVLARDYIAGWILNARQ